MKRAKTEAILSLFPQTLISIIRLYIGYGILVYARQRANSEIIAVLQFSQSVLFIARSKQM